MQYALHNIFCWPNGGSCVKKSPWLVPGGPILSLVAKMNLENASLIIVPYRVLICNSEGDFSSECMGICWPRMLTITSS